MKYVLGLDQGGSKTHAVIADGQGHILGCGTGRGACHSATGMQDAMDAVLEAVEQAARQAGIAPEQMDAVVAGLTGADWPYETVLLTDALRDTLQIPREKITVVNDCIIALRAGTSQPQGCILCAGSALNCGVRHADGREYVYGYYIEGKCQGGGALGQRAVQAVYDAEMLIGPATVLTEKVLEHFGFASADEMLYAHVNGKIDQKKWLQLTRVLDDAALAGDRAAQQALREFAADIARYVVGGLRRFDMLGDRVEIVLSGGVFKMRAPQLIDTVRQVILSAAPHAVIVESVYEPVIGAALMALDSLGGDEAQIRGNMDSSARLFHMVRKD